MTFINLTKSQFLFPLLQKMLLGLTQLSGSDSALNQQVYQLHHLLSDPHKVDGEALLEVLDEAQNLASSYEEVNGRKNENELVAALPKIFYTAQTEAEHMVKSKKLMGLPSSKVAQIEREVERFYRLAVHYTKIECPSCRKPIHCRTERRENILGEEADEFDVPDLCPHCKFPIANEYDNIGFGDIA
jgi:hypothetical protein